MRSSIVSPVMLAFSALGLVSCAWPQSTQFLRTPSVAFVEDGMTTKQEIIETLGEPFVSFKPEKAMAYQWEKSRSTDAFPGLRDEHELVVKYRVLVVQFNEND